jgi:hypothetical protein
VTAGAAQHRGGARKPAPPQRFDQGVAGVLGGGHLTLPVDPYGSGNPQPSGLEH